MSLLTPRTNIQTRLAIQKSRSSLLNGATINGLMYYDDGGFTSLSAATNGQIPIGNTGNPPTLATLTGTTDQVNVANAAGSITLSAPQDIATDSSVTFANVTDSALTSTRVVLASTAGLLSDSANLTFASNVLAVNGTTKLGDGGTTNYAQFATDGELTLYGTARSWKSYDIDPTSVKHPSANGPGSTEYENHYYEAYDASSMEQIFYLWHVPDDYAAGSASVRGHFGLMVANPPTDPDPTEIVAMGFEYYKFEAGEVNTFSADGGGALDISIVQDETAYTWHESATGVCTTTGWEAGDLVMFRFFRDIDAEYSANDDYDGGDALLGVYHLEYLRDKLGAAS